MKINRKVKFYFISIYLIFIAAISSFYLDILNEHDRAVLSIHKELYGVDYLNNMHQLSLNIFSYQEAVKYYNKDQQKTQKIYDTILASINNLHTYQKKYLEFKDTLFNEQLSLIKESVVSYDIYYKFFDYLNHENYRIGDASELLFVNDRKLHFLVSLITHYLPEFSISVMLTHNIAEEYILNGVIDNRKKSIFIEQNKLMNLSFDEINGIVKLLDEYSDTHILSATMEEIAKNMEYLAVVNRDFFDTSKSNYQYYLKNAHSLLQLTQTLHQQNAELLKDTLNAKEVLLNEKILFYHLLLAFIIVLISVVFIYFYMLYRSNRKKDSEIRARQEHLERLNQSLKDQSHQNYMKATHDSLTGIKNRVYFNEALPDMFFLAQRHNTPLSIIFLDIDLFKNINDTYGHVIGDKVLVHITTIITHMQRQSDLFARWGGEEFIILLPNTKKEDAVSIAEALRKKIATNVIAPLETLTVSFGVTSLQESDSKDLFLSRADEALYNAKAEGRNRVCSL